MNRLHTLVFVTSILLFAGAIAVKAQSTSVFDANYFNTDNTAPPIKVGKGFHINDIYKQTRSCFTPASSDPKKLTPQQAGGKKTAIRFFYTKTNAQYNEFKTKGYSGKVSFLNLFSLGGSKLEEFSTKSIVNDERIIFTATVDFGIYSFDTEPVLIPEAKALITKNSVQDFVKMYGTHYISGVRKESSISVVLTRVRKEDEASLGISTSSDVSVKVPFKGKGSLEIEGGNWINNELSSHEFSVSIDISGPEIDKSNLQGQIKSILNGDDYSKGDAIANLIEGALKNISDPNKGIYTQYYYSPFSLYGLDGIYWDEKKQNKLTKINEAVIAVYSVKTEIEEALSESGKEELEEILSNSNLSEEYKTQIMSAFNGIKPDLQKLKLLAEGYLTGLETRYNACSDVYCVGTSECCNNETYIKEITDLNIQSKVDAELQKVMDVIVNVVKEVTKPECEKKQLGVITIKNLSSNPYHIYQGSQFIETLAGGETKAYYVSNGTYDFKAVQKSGYAFYPTENFRRATITGVCHEVILKIGFED